MSGPIEQFEIKPIIPIHLGGFDVSFTNSALFMVIGVVVSTLFLLFCTRKRDVVPGMAQSMAEVLYEFIAGLLKDNVGKEGLKFFPVIFSLFIFVAMGNLLGLLPYSFTYTSQLGAVGGLSVCGLIFLICVGIKTKGWGYLHTFMPKGVPWVAAPLIIPIEIISYLSKPFSLTVRLVANMTVGHIMLKILAGFVLPLAAVGIPLGIIGGAVPIVFNGCIIIFETFVALLQAYIYTILTCVYLSDALHHH